MNLKHLQYFRVIAELEHITQAAARLSITQPSLSHAVSELERELGTTLFEKQGRNIRLTKYGKLFLEYVNRALEELDKGEKMMRELADPCGGRIDLAFTYALGSHFIPQIVQAFSEEEANRKIALSFHEGNAKHLLQGLKEDRFDLVFCTNEERDSEIEFIPLLEQELVLVAPLGHPLAEYDSVNLKETEAYPYISFSSRNGMRQVIDTLFDKARIKPRIACEIEEENAAAGLVSAGCGITILPRSAMLDHYKVKVLPITHPIYRRYICMAQVKNRYLSPAATQLRDFAVAKFGSIPEPEAFMQL